MDFVTLRRIAFRNGETDHSGMPLRPLFQPHGRIEEPAHVGIKAILCFGSRTFGEYLLCHCLLPASLFTKL
jgi:hypothetical protein